MVTDTTIFTGYVLAFGTATSLCFGSLRRAREINDAETRRGFVWLLLLSGGWALAHVGYLVGPTVKIKLAFYYAGLIVGIAAVGPWLYLCSAYTGRTLHRAPIGRQLAVGLFFAIILVKLTNPFHHLYFRASTAATPFNHLVISHGIAHWLAMGVAYALALVGVFMLIELFWRVGKDTLPLIILVGITSVPIVFDIGGVVTPQLVNMTYSPLGVSIFAVGILYLYLEEFETIQLAGEHENAIVFADEETRIRDFNSEASALFPWLETGVKLEDVIPNIEANLGAGETVINIDRDDETHYYRLSVNPYTTGNTQLGKSIVFTDVTEREQYRQELERQNDRLEQFASVVSHDLRNPLNVAKLRTDLAQQECNSDHLDQVNTAHDRMERLINDLLALARQGQPIDDPVQVVLSTVTMQAWEVVETETATLQFKADLTFEADEDRLQQLLENLFRNAIKHGGNDVTVTVGSISEPSGFYVADDGQGIPEADRETVFEFGYSTNDEGTGFGLAIVREIATAHDWDTSVTDNDGGGTRFEITRV